MCALNLRDGQGSIRPAIVLVQWSGEGENHISISTKLSLEYLCRPAQLTGSQRVSPVQGLGFT